MKAIKYFVLTLVSATAFAQPLVESDQHEESLKRVEKRIGVVERQTSTVSATLTVVKQDSIKEVKKLAAAMATVKSHAEQLEFLKSSQAALLGRIDEVEGKATAQAKSLGSVVSSRSNIFGVMVGAMLLLGAVGYWQRRRRETKTNENISSHLAHVSTSLRASEERIAKADTALAESLIEVLNRIKAETQPVPLRTGDKVQAVDHNLPTKLADEIHRMRKRLVSLPEETKGLTPLKKSLERLESELLAYGYEIVDHTGKPYSETLSVKARFVPSDELAPDERIISKVVVPQLNYNGVLVRMADVEVSIGS